MKDVSQPDVKQWQWLTISKSIMKYGWLPFNKTLTIPRHHLNRYPFFFIGFGKLVHFNQDYHFADSISRYIEVAES